MATLLLNRASEAVAVTIAQLTYLYPFINTLNCKVMIHHLGLLSSKWNMHKNGHPQRVSLHLRFILHSSESYEYSHKLTQPSKFLAFSYF